MPPENEGRIPLCLATHGATDPPDATDMKPAVLLPVICLAGVLGFTAADTLSDSHAAAIFPGERWAYIPAPARGGWSPEKLSQAEVFANRIGTAAFMLVEGGRVTAAWGPVDHRFPPQSIRKPFLSARFGIHVTKGGLDLS